MADALPTRWPQILTQKQEITTVIFTKFDFWRMIQAYMPTLIPTVELDKAYQPLNVAGELYLNGKLIDSSTELMMVVRRAG